MIYPIVLGKKWVEEPVGINVNSNATQSISLVEGKLEILILGSHVMNVILTVSKWITQVECVTGTLENKGLTAPKV